MSQRMQCSHSVARKLAEEEFIYKVAVPDLGKAITGSTVMKVAMASLCRWVRSQQEWLRNKPLTRPDRTVAGGVSVVRCQ
jgi:hypothetical protein